MLLRKVCLGILLICSLYTFGQVELFERYEFQPKERIYSLSIITKGSDGCVISYLTMDGKNGPWLLHLEALDNEFNSLKKNSYEITQSSTRLKVQGDSLYHFEYTEKTGNYDLKVINLSTLEYKVFSGKIVDKMNVRNVSILKNKILILYRNTRADKQSFRILDILNDTESNVTLSDYSKYKRIGYESLREIGTTDGGELQIHFKHKTPEKNMVMLVFRYNSDGKLIGNKPLELSIGPNKEIEDLKIVQKQDGKGYLMSGTYSENKVSIIEGIFYEGIFTGALDHEGNIDNYNTYRFLDISNFEQTYNESPLMVRVKYKLRKTDNGEQKLIYDGKLKNHFIYTAKDKNYLAFEFSHNLYHRKDHELDKLMGYQHTYAVIASLDNDGALEWSDTYKTTLTKDVKSTYYILEKHVNSNGDLELSYTDNYNIHFLKYDKGGHMLKEPSMNPIETGIEGDVVKKTGRERISYWYDDYYFMKGFQVIKGKNKRRTYFISKFKYL